MQTITFVTGNAIKISSATQTCAAFGITVDAVALDIVEIQAEAGEPIARDKAQKAYDALQKPLIVVDDSWIIPAMNGFPGPYMKSMNHWFTAEDWLRFTAHLTDRRIILRQYAVYQDSDGQKLFTNDITGTLLTKASGPTQDNANENIVCFNNEGKSTAEMRALGYAHPIGDNQTVWDDIAPWLARK